MPKEIYSAFNRIVKSVAIYIDTFVHIFINVLLKRIDIYINVSMYIATDFII